VAAKQLENTATDYQVFAVVVVHIGSRCFEDVFTTRWRQTPNGWRLVPSKGVQPV
jgi:hypothetical protein